MGVLTGGRKSGKRNSTKVYEPSRGHIGSFLLNKDLDSILLSSLAEGFSIFENIYNIAHVLYVNLFFQLFRNNQR